MYSRLTMWLIIGSLWRRASCSVATKRWKSLSVRHTAENCLPKPRVGLITRGAHRRGKRPLSNWSSLITSKSGERRPACDSAVRHRSLKTAFSRALAPGVRTPMASAAWATGRMAASEVVITASRRPWRSRSSRSAARSPSPPREGIRRCSCRWLRCGRRRAESALEMARKELSRGSMKLTRHPSSRAVRKAFRPARVESTKAMWGGLMVQGLGGGEWRERRCGAPAAAAAPGRRSSPAPGTGPCR